MQFDLTKAKNGVLLVDKPAGWTSFDVCAKIRGQIRAEYTARGEKPTKRQLRVGHAGTLDPFATGLLVVLLGDATKKAETLLKFDKTYTATIRLGATSSTGDTEGEITPLSSDVPSKDQVLQALTQFVGTIEQTPPAHSAIKINGQRAYKLARQQREVAMPTRQVTIHALEMQNYAYPDISIRCHVGSGTYIRSLAADIGSALGTGAYCAELRRQSVGPYQLD